jgi:hypothetical protein
MTEKKQSRRKTSAKKLEPIDWREFANDAVLNGNMSTLYRRPPSEDPSAYASAEALIEIEKRIVRSMDDGVAGVDRDGGIPTVGCDDTVGAEPPVPFPSPTPIAVAPTVGPPPTMGVPGRGDTSDPQLDVPPTMGMLPTVPSFSTALLRPTVGISPADDVPPTVALLPTVSATPTVGPMPAVALPESPIVPTAPALPTEGSIPTVGTKAKKKIKPIRDIQDALTLAGQILYRAMSSSPEGSSRGFCTKGYRQLAAETRLDKDTVRDLIVEFKQKGIVRETATYDPDTRLAKTYQVLSNDIILQQWREAGIQFVTAGRQRPQFCSVHGVPIIPTVGS